VGEGVEKRWGRVKKRRERGGGRKERMCIFVLYMIRGGEGWITRTYPGLTSRV